MSGILTHELLIVVDFTFTILLFHTVSRHGRFEPM
jgi:hypothetical protein